MQQQVQQHVLARLAAARCPAPAASAAAAAAALQVRVGGLAHFMLPLSSLDSEKARTRPFMYVDIGMVLFLEQMFRMGARKEHCIVKVAGGSQLLDTNDIFRIGQRNHTVLRKILWKNGMLLKGEEVGGALSRTMRLDLIDGRVTIKAHGETREL